MKDPELFNNNNIPGDDPKPITVKRFFFEILQTILLAFLLYFAIDAVVARVRVENISMQPTLKPGEFLLVNKLAYKLGSVGRGDIILFHFPKDPSDDYIKRAIGLPGDHVRIENGRVYINSAQLNETYTMADPTYNGEWNVPQDAIFALGDNRNQSSDSHSWGFVPMDNLVGKAFFIYWPLNEIKSLKQMQIVEAATK